MASEIIEIRPHARANARVFVTCSLDGCSNVAKTSGLCNPHYMEQWRHTLSSLEEEISRATKTHGPPTDYYCEADIDCPNTAMRWYVENGNTPRAFCAAHSEALVEVLRMNIRRLELK